MKFKAPIAILVFTVMIIIVLVGAFITHGQTTSCNPIVVDKQGIEHPFTWLTNQYPGMSCIGVSDSTKEHFAIKKIVWMTSGDTILRLWLRDHNGFPIAGQPTTYWYPNRINPNDDLPAIATQWQTRCAPRGVQNKNTSSGFGNVDFQIGSSSWINGDRGPYGAQVLSISDESECIEGLGWVPYTNHEGPVEVFFELVPAQTVSTPSPTPGINPTPVPIQDLTEVNTHLIEIRDILQKILDDISQGKVFYVPSVAK